MESNELLREVKRAVLETEPSAEVFLYGSRARGDFREDSDWDLLVLLDGTVDMNREDAIQRALNPIEWSTGEVLCPLIRDRVAWNRSPSNITPLYENVCREGIKL